MPYGTWYANWNFKPESVVPGVGGRIARTTNTFRRNKRLLHVQRNILCQIRHRLVFQGVDAPSDTHSSNEEDLEVMVPTIDARKTLINFRFGDY